MMVTILFNILFLMFVAAIIVFVAQYKSKKKQHLMLLETQKQLHLKELMGTELEIQQQTMHDLGQEIHDNVGQLLTLASLYTRQLACDAPPQSDKAPIDRINNLLDQSLSELRGLSHSLINHGISNKTVVELLSNECEKLADVKCCKFHCDTAVNSLEVSYQIKSVLTRILQEFIQNCIRHSECHNITVSLFRTAHGLQLLLTDDGKGFDTSRVEVSGIGITNMKKRTALIGGNFELNSNPQGTRLTIDIPMI